MQSGATHAQENAQLLILSEGASDFGDLYSHSNWTMLVQCQHADSRKSHVSVNWLTWIPRSAIGASVVPRYRLQKILQHALIASLLSLADGAGHVVEKVHVPTWKGVTMFLSSERDYMRQVVR